MQIYIQHLSMFTVFTVNVSEDLWGYWGMEEKVKEKELLIIWND